MNVLALGACWSGMISDAKLRQSLYHHFCKVPDAISESEYVVVAMDEDDLIRTIIEYFIKDSKMLVYPAKSYAVAIIYAHLKQKLFGDDFFASLRDPDLLYGNDKYFIPYESGRNIYDKVWAELQKTKSYPTSGKVTEQVAKTEAFFHEEFFTRFSSVGDIVTYLTKISMENNF